MKYVFANIEVFLDGRLLENTIRSIVFGWIIVGYLLTLTSLI